MAIWQFKFDLAPRETIVRMHGPDVVVLGAFAPIDSNTWVENADSPNYWIGHSPQDYAKTISALLPPMSSWSEDAIMFGEDGGDRVELWTDGFHVRLDVRKFNRTLAQTIVTLAASDDLKLIMNETGRLIPAVYEKLARELANSRALKFVEDPMGTLQRIGREQD
jgi:hypothetical protein